jgi:hypothetical protein
MDVPINLVNAILQYLDEKPHKEVSGLIRAILQLQTVNKESPDTDQKELPLV